MYITIKNKLIIEFSQLAAL